VLTANVFIWQWNERDEQRANFVDLAVRRLGEIPGVIAAGATSSLPIPERIGPDQGAFAIVGQPSAEGERPSAHVSVVTPGVFDVLRIPLRSGRLFTSADDATRLPVALINESLARRYWPRESAIGKRILLRFGRFPGGGPAPEREIVGVVRDTRQSGLEADPRPAIFIPHAQYPTGSITLVLRTRSDPTLFVSRLRLTMASLNRELPLATVATLDALLDSTLKPRRFGLILLGSFSVAALILAVIGVYGSIAQHAAERKQEIGVRLALGASGRDVLALMLRRGIAPAALGVAGGLAIAAPLTHLLRAMLYAVAPLDGFTFAAVPAVMLATAAFACWLPAWRATRVDPTLTLRGD
jgi:putative ABC transport system permease protein